MSTPGLVGSILSGLAGAVATCLGGIVLTGMLTVVVGRAVFGANITVREAWQRVRGRLLALLGFSLLEIRAVLVLAVVVDGVIIGSPSPATHSPRRSWVSHWGSA